MTNAPHIQSMIKRLARLEAAEMWSDGLNPAQRAALEYLGQANRFSRAPSHVAEYLGSTRGTVSQTLKALLRKGYVVEERSEEDKRSIWFDLTPQGEAALKRQSSLARSLNALSPGETSALESTLKATLKGALTHNGQKPFGVCKTCKYFQSHRKGPSEGGHCQLLDVDLTGPGTEKICHEHQPSDA